VAAPGRPPPARRPREADAGVTAQVEHCSAGGAGAAPAPRKITAQGRPLAEASTRLEPKVQRASSFHCWRAVLRSSRAAGLLARERQQQRPGDRRARRRSSEEGLEYGIKMRLGFRTLGRSGLLQRGRVDQPDAGVAEVAVCCGWPVAATGARAIRQSKCPRRSTESSLGFAFSGYNCKALWAARPIEGVQFDLQPSVFQQLISALCSRERRRLNALAVWPLIAQPNTTTLGTHNVLAGYWLSNQHNLLYQPGFCIKTAESYWYQIKITRRPLRRCSLPFTHPSRFRPATAPNQPSRVYRYHAY